MIGKEELAPRKRRPELLPVKGGGVAMDQRMQRRIRTCRGPETCGGDALGLPVPLALEWIGRQMYATRIAHASQVSPVDSGTPDPRRRKPVERAIRQPRSEEHTSELQSLM